MARGIEIECVLGWLPMLMNTIRLPHFSLSSRRPLERWVDYHSVYRLAWRYGCIDAVS